ncbi:MAG: ROK family transcriptional regulator [Propionibacteriaceae bacterium]|jgi:predicted NBD/HSP70 family sugar kinase|nr:ROK family transcriptional regulator [Propionibacteriaceae bacterium]
MTAPASSDNGALVVPANSSPTVLDLIRHHDGISRAEVARRIAVTRQAVSKIVSDLVAQGLVTETGTRPNGVGRAPTGLTLIPSSRFALGVHLDRSGALVILVDLAGAVCGQVSRTTPVLPPGEYVEVLAGAVDELLAQVPGAAGRTVGCGVGMAGPVDHHTGVATAPNNFANWRDVPIGDLLGRRLGLPVALDKETNMALMARDWAIDHDGWSIVLFVGTGIGGAVMLDGEIYRGPHSDAAELGHMILDPAGPPCVCGRRGCVEVFTSPAAVVQAYTQPDQADTTPRWSSSTRDALRRIVAAADAGERHAIDTLAAAGARLAVAASNAVRLLDIDDVVLTGPLLDEYGPRFVEAVEANLSWTDGARARGAKLSVSAQMQPTAIARGAAISVLRTVGVGGA